MDHLARRGRDIHPDFERVGVDVGELPARQVGEHILQPLEQAFAARLDRASDHFGIGDRKVRGRQRVGHILRGEFHLRARMLVEPLHGAGGREQLFGEQAVGLADQREDRVGGPVGIGETLVFRRIGVRRERRLDRRERSPEGHALFPQLRRLFGPQLGGRILQPARGVEHTRRGAVALVGLTQRIFEHHLLRAAHDTGPMLQVIG